ncbi:rhodanese-like domain-containing protein [Aquimarina addita]|uniref:Rhodanese-like domain-containing protein n=1 Tax=Aquimarina addita TaxID=870485 RepID=A0ABP7XBG1_9FLAO
MEKQIEYYQNKLAYEMDPSDLFDALGNEEDVIIIDTRKSFGYEKEHIPRAINLPHREMTITSTKHLDKTKTYICYCDGIGCNASTKGALNMAKLGFKVKELIGGIVWWKLDGYATEGTKPSEGTIIQCAC